MRRLSLALCLGLSSCLLTATAALARDAAPASERLFAVCEAPTASISPAGLRADTLFLFAASGPGAYGMPGTNARGYTFDNGAGGPATAGWTAFDMTAQLGAYWHLQALTLSNGHATDFSAAEDFADGGPTAGNDYAWWCGRENACGWTHPTGYGTNWAQWLVLSVPAAATAGSLEFDYIGDFEGNEYDFFTLYRRTGDADPVEVLGNTAEGERTLIHYGPIAFGDVDELIFAFESDGGWSDEDGSFLTDIGAVWIDNLEVDYTGAPDVAWDFESGIEADFPALAASYAPGAGIYGVLYAGLFAEDACITNGTHAWAFFDLYTTNPEYPIPVTPYGPPYFDNGIQSPLFEKAHALGDAEGISVDAALDMQSSKFLVRAMVYCDLPLDALVFYMLHVAAQVEGTPCLSGWVNNNTVYYGNDGWRDMFIDYTLRMATAAGGGNVQGLSLAFTAIDMCDVWCGIGYEEAHTPAPYFDTISAMLVASPPVAWNIDQFRRFQDNFPEANGKVRIDSAIDVQPTASTTLVIGDSTKIDLAMDGEGGIKPDLVSVPGQLRPSLYLYWRVVAGPHAGSTAAAMGDPDAGDGIYSPWIGTAVVNGQTWNIAIADSARYQGIVSPGSFAFDFADDYFEPGDVIQFYYKGISLGEKTHTSPTWAESSDEYLRRPFTVRCLPTPGAPMLLVEDCPSIGAPPEDQLATYWQMAFKYNGYGDYDTYTTQAPSSGLHNGLGGRAEIGDIDQYEMIVWDSGDLPTYTIQNALPDDIAFDDVLLDDWLNGSAHNTGLWVMGNEIASDLEDEPSFLGQDLGAIRILSGTYYDDLTGVTTPRVIATHPALEINGYDPYFKLDGACPTPERFDLVARNPSVPLAVEAMAWQVTGGSQAKAGIYNQDPDGNGNGHSPGSFTNRALFNPFSYSEVRDTGFGQGDGYYYIRRMVGDVLSNLFGYEPNAMPLDADAVPAHFALAGAYPNPFNPKTTLRFSLAAPERVRLVVYDLAGRRVRTLVDAPLPAAHHEAVWDGRDEAGARVASGVYFVRLVAGDFQASEKLLLLK